MKGIIGFSGFVGGNLDKQQKFDKKYNSKNIDSIKGEEFDLLVCAGVSAVKWFANQNPEKDILGIERLKENLKEVKAKKMVLISTIDIYTEMGDIDEDIIPDIDKQDFYGRHRYQLEKWCQNNFENISIIRLPALFSQGLKKNFLYDLMNRMPSIIVESKMEELRDKLSEDKFNKINFCYIQDETQNYKLQIKDEMALKHLIEYGFTSLVFTDRDSYFPFYYLDNLKKDIDIALKNEIKILNLSVEPITCKEIANKILNLKFDNKILNKEPLKYEFKSKYCELYNGSNGYLYSKEKTLDYLKEFFTKEGVI